MEIKQQLVESRDKCFDGVNPVEWLVVHETGNSSVGADAQAHADLQSSGNVRNASWHYQIDDHEAIQSYLDTVQCWHAGDGEGPGNLSGLAFEMCVNADGDYEATVRNTIELLRAKRAQYGLGRDRVVQHNYFSGKDCPKLMRSRGAAAWATFVAATDPAPSTKPQKEAPMKFVNPLKGVITSGYDPKRWHPTLKRVVPHYGSDVGGRPRGITHYIGAIADGKVIYVRTNSYAGDRRGGYLPRLTGNQVVVDHGTYNGQRLLSYYGHFASISVRKGQRVAAGQRLGVMGATGDVAGAHLHLEIWVNGYTVDPAAWLRSQGVSLGTGTTTVSSSKPVAKPKPTTPKPKKDSQVLSVQKRLKKLGYYKGANDGIAGPWYRDGVNAYIKAQLYAPGVRADGVWGPAAEAHYQWTRTLQKALNRWKGRKIPVDGDYGSNTRSRVRDVMQRNHGGAYKGKVDSIPGPVFCRMLNIPTHPGL